MAGTDMTSVPGGTPSRQGAFADIPRSNCDVPRPLVGRKRGPFPPREPQAFEGRLSHDLIAHLC